VNKDGNVDSICSYEKSIERDIEEREYGFGILIQKGQENYNGVDDRRGTLVQLDVLVSVRV